MMKNTLKVFENINNKVAITINDDDACIGVFVFECEVDIETFVNELLAVKGRVYNEIN